MTITISAATKGYIAAARGAMRAAQQAGFDLSDKQAAARRASAKLCDARKHATGSSTTDLAKACDKAQASWQRAADAATVASYTVEALQDIACAKAAQACASALRDAGSCDGIALASDDFAHLRLEVRDLVLDNQPYDLTVTHHALDVLKITLSASPWCDSSSQKVFIGYGQATVFAASNVFTDADIALLTADTERVKAQVADGCKQLKQLQRRAQKLAQDAAHASIPLAAARRLRADLYDLAEVL